MKTVTSFRMKEEAISPIRRLTKKNKKKKDKKNKNKKNKKKSLAC